MESNTIMTGVGKHEADQHPEMESSKRAKFETQEPIDEICDKQEIKKDQEIGNTEIQDSQAFATEAEIQDSQAFATEDSQPLDNYVDSTSLGMFCVYLARHALYLYFV